MCTRTPVTCATNHSSIWLHKEGLFLPGLFHQLSHRHASLVKNGPYHDGDGISFAQSY